MSDFNPLTALLGGALIGLSATLLWAGLGRVAGISGIAAGLLRRESSETPWRVAFLVGLLGGGALFFTLFPDNFRVDVQRSAAAMVAAGLLIGFGTRLGSGCTSGHGVCGLSRLSPRSLTAVLTFMLTGGLSVLATRWVLGGV